jgi:hypothetical protein
MKFIILFLFFNVKYLTLISQISKTNICTICDSIARKNCGQFMKIEYEKIDKKKLKSDLKAIAIIQTYLLDSLKSNLVIDSKYKISYLKNVSDSIRKITKTIVLNYFEVDIYEIMYEGVNFKYAGIKSEKTSSCNLNKEKIISDFDKRLIKPLLSQLKVKYAFLTCRTVYLNFIGPLYIPKKAIKPINISKNIISPNKDISDFLK